MTSHHMRVAHLHAPHIHNHLSASHPPSTPESQARQRCISLITLAPFPDVATGWARGLERVAATNTVVAGVLRAKLAAEGATSAGGGKVGSLAYTA